MITVLSFLYYFVLSCEALSVSYVCKTYVLCRLNAALFDICEPT